MKGYTVYITLHRRECRVRVWTPQQGWIDLVDAANGPQMGAEQNTIERYVFDLTEYSGVLLVGDSAKRALSNEEKASWCSLRLDEGKISFTEKSTSWKVDPAQSFNAILSKIRLDLERNAVSVIDHLVVCHESLSKSVPDEVLSQFSVLKANSIYVNGIAGLFDQIGQLQVTGDDVSKVFLFEAREKCMRLSTWTNDMHKGWVFELQIEFANGWFSKLSKSLFRFFLSLFNVDDERINLLLKNEEELLNAIQQVFLSSAAQLMFEPLVFDFYIQGQQFNFQVNSTQFKNLIVTTLKNEFEVLRDYVRIAENGFGTKVVFIGELNQTMKLVSHILSKEEDFREEMEYPTFSPSKPSSPMNSMNLDRSISAKTLSATFHIEDCSQTWSDEVHVLLSDSDDQTAIQRIEIPKNTEGIKFKVHWGEHENLLSHSNALFHLGAMAGGTLFLRREPKLGMTKLKVGYGEHITSFSMLIAMQGIVLSKSYHNDSRTSTDLTTIPFDRFRANNLTHDFGMSESVNEYFSKLVIL